MTRVLSLFLALVLLPFTAAAQTTVSGGNVSIGPVQTAGPVLFTPATAADATQLASDGSTAVSQVKSGQTVSSGTAAAVNADINQVAADTGVSAKKVTVKGHVVNLTVGGAALANIAFPSKAGSTVSVAGGGGLGLLLGASFGSNPDGSDHYHLGLSLGINSLTFTSTVGETSTTSTVPAFVAAILPSYQPSGSAPQYGLGPVLEIPLAGSIRKPIIGFTFTTGFDFVAHQFGG